MSRRSSIFPGRATVRPVLSLMKRHNSLRGRWPQFRHSRIRNASVVGGSIGGREELLNRVRASVSKCSSRPVEVVASVLGHQATLVGGAAVGLGQLHTILFSGGVPGAEIALPPADVVKLAGVRQ